MRIEATINGQILPIEVPTGGGIDKGGGSRAGDPNQVLQNVSSAVRAVAGQLGHALTPESHLSPVAMEVRFGVRIDDKALVSIGISPAEAQFLVTLKFDA